MRIFWIKGKRLDFSEALNGFRPKRGMKPFCLFLISLCFSGAVSAQESQKAFRVEAAEVETIETKPRSTLTAVFRVVNLSSHAEEFAGSAEVPEGWRVLTEESPFLLAAGEETIRLVTFFVPPKATAAPYQITYAVQTTGNSHSAETGAVTVNVLLAVGLQIQTVEQPRIVVAGESYQVRFLLVNESNAAGTLEMEIHSSEGYKCTPRFGPIHLDAGESRALAVTVETDPEIRASLFHRLQLTAKFLVASREVLKAQALSSVEVIPRTSGEKNGYHRLPLEIKFIGVSKKDSGTETQIGLSGSGSIDDKGTKKIDFLYRGPRSKSITTFFPWEDEARLSFGTDRGELHIGDRIFTLSRLVEYGHYRRGAEGRIRLGPFDLSAYYMVDPFLRFDQRQLAFQLGYDVGKRAQFHFNYLESNEPRAPGAGSGERTESNIISLQAQISAYRKILNFNLEYALGKKNAQEGKIGNAIWLEGFGTSSKLSYRLSTLRADRNYPGYYRDLEFDAGNLSFVLVKNLGFNSSYLYQKINRSLESDFPSSLEEYSRAGFYYRLGKWTYFTFDYRNRDWKDISSDPKYHYDENSFRIGVNQVFGPLSLNASADIGQTKDILAGRSAQLVEYVAQASLRAANWLSFGGYLDFRNQEKGFTGNRFNRLTADFYLNLNSGPSSLAAMFRTSFHREFSEEVSMDVSRIERILLHEYDLFDISFKHRLNIGHTVGFRLRGLSNSGPARNLNVIGLVEYTIPLGLPISRKTDKGELKGRVYDTAKDNSGIAGVVIRANDLAVVTDKNGNFVFYGLKPGEYNLILDQSTLGSGRVARQGMPLKETIQGGVTTELNIGVARAASLSGQLMVYRFEEDRLIRDFRGPEDTPEMKVVEAYGLKDALVELESKWAHYARTTDDNGRFSFDELYPGQWTLKVFNDSAPPLHYLENDVFEFTLAPGEEGRALVRILPKVREIKIINSEETGLKSGVIQEIVSSPLKINNDKVLKQEKALQVACSALPDAPAEKKNDSYGYGSLKDIVLHKSEESLEIDLLLDSYSFCKEFKLLNPSRIVIDFCDVGKIEAKNQIRIDDFGIRAIRVGQFDPLTARVVFEIEKEIPSYKIEKIPAGVRIKIPGKTGKASKNR
jgi:uncharacterized protein (DUF2141 family)